MDDTRQNRPSGIPRPSKLPQPSKLPVPRTNSIRTSASRESLGSAAGTGTLRNPKLRTAASRDQLAPPSSPGALRSVSSPHSRAGLNPASGGVGSRTAKSGVNTTPQPPRLGRGTNAGGPGSRSSSVATGLRRQSSQQWISAAAMPEEDAGLGDSWTMVPEDPAEEAMPESPNKVRPSLAERTMETLSRLPSSPSVKGRGAPSFYDAASGGRKSPSRPDSSHQSDGSGGRSRPSSSGGLDSSIASLRSQPATFENPLSPIEGTPLRNRRSIQSFQTPSKRTSMYGVPPPSTITVPRARSPSPGKRGPEIPTPKPGSKMLAPRQPVKRPSVNSLRKPAAPAGAKPKTGTARKESVASRGSSTTSWDTGTNPSSASVTSANTSVTAESAEPAQAYKKTSAALREQIAKARAAKKAVTQPAAPPDSADGTPRDSTAIPADTAYDFALSNDPFNQNRDDKSQAKVLHSRLETARTSGRLNIAAMGLKEIPADVLNMYNLNTIGQSGGAWAESVDLTRFVAADNELEMIGENMFPDVDPMEAPDDEDSQGNIFAGLETLDLHGNILVTLPMGLRRLSLLTSLNLSLNRLANNCLEVISQITPLKDLKLGGNLLYGALESCFSKLTNLEILDLHGNNISSLPADFSSLSRLRILNLSENSFEELPFPILSGLPLTELVARKNQLQGTLIQDGVDTLPLLQTLDVSSNQLTHICSASKTVTMPALHQLCVSMNRLQALPDISSWASLLTIAADENSINAIPEGFAQLPKLRSVDFSSNDIRVVPLEIGRMENLANLRLSGNPLREKKFSTISTEEMKTILAQRLEPAQEQTATRTQRAQSTNQDEYFTADDTLAPAAHLTITEDEDSRSELDHFATPPTSAPGSPAGRSQPRPRAATATWPVQPGGVLDRSNTQSSALHPVICSKLAASHKIHEIQLHHNLFATLPDSLTFFAASLTALSLAHNQLLGETYLTGVSGGAEGSGTALLDLPALKELNLAHNHITGLVPLMVHLCAPRLEKLDVSFNRLTALPQPTSSTPENGRNGYLRDTFPFLTVLLASNNHLVELDPEAIRGLRVVDVANNDIAHLNPRIGLLGATQPQQQQQDGASGSGLERLDVSGNRFRVPRWNVLERGTEATLRWLRGRVPVAEMGAWKGEEGDDEDVD
ncbi:uncharacterized protein C8A04DRAFT_35648 [Dichotomopilus funicola]|uniref:Leucine-rich repeat-containing protein 40 n=1 Tax=Dichotomopilus funicola TaxID=1934379 RepID=A0AAN6V706_9PEZI|nr:hypothetical protein C8A04DRAFT_35648 [Dichotomopilus funicola]